MTRPSRPARRLIVPPRLGSGRLVVQEEADVESAVRASVPGALANGQTCAVTSNEVSVSLPCGLESGAVTTSGKQLRWTIRNTDTEAATLSGLTVSWPEANGYLSKVKLDGDNVWDDTVRCVSGVCTATFTSGDFTSDVNKKSIPAGGSRVLILEFEKNAVTNLARYDVTVSINASCSLSFDGTMGCDIAGGRSSTHNEEFRWPLTNNAERTTVSGLTITWPASNGYLDKIQLDGDTIWDGRIDCAGGVCSATITSAQLVTDVNKKSISTGQTRQLKLVFQNNASTDLSAYTVSVNFHAGCAITYTPPPPTPVGSAVCSDLKPIDGIELEFSSLLADGRTVSSVQWYRTTVSNLASPNPADFVGSHGPIADGEIFNFAGFAARSATNDVDFVVALSDGSVVRSRFHRSCSDSAMNDIADCGSPQGDGKNNDAGPNIWLLRNLSGNGLVLGCPAP